MSSQLFCASFRREENRNRACNSFDILNKYWGSFGHKLSLGMTFVAARQTISRLKVFGVACGKQNLPSYCCLALAKQFFAIQPNVNI